MIQSVCPSFFDPLAHIYYMNLDIQEEGIDVAESYQNYDCNGYPYQLEIYGTS